MSVNQLQAHVGRVANLQSWGITLLRVVVGIVFLAHGWQKLYVHGIDGVTNGMGQLGLPVPMLSAIAVIAAEFLGGIALLLGLFTRWAALVLVFVMLVAMTVVHLRNGFFISDGGFEYTLTLLAANLSLALAGPGEAALDAVLGRHKD